LLPYVLLKSNIAGGGISPIPFQELTMSDPRKPGQEIDAAALEASLPTLTKKLQELKGGLSPDEQAVFSSIVNSAALHLQAMQAIGKVAEIRYEKPISAVATVGVRQALINLPEKLGLNK
jgi:hypothetical protein